MHRSARWAHVPQAFTHTLEPTMPPIPKIHTPQAPPPTTVLPRTHVNSAMRTPYVPAAEPAVRPGSNDHRRYATKGNPT